MAKQLDWVNMNAGGSEAGVNASSVSFSYCVCDDAESKFQYTGVYVVSGLDINDTVDEVWDAAVAAIKTVEGIS